MKDYGEVWYHPDAITNILSLSNVAKKYPVSFHSETENQFVVHKPSGDRIFSVTDYGLYRFDPTDKQNFSFLSVQEQIRQRFSKREYEDAKKARDLHAMVGYPSESDFKKMITYGLVHNWDVTLKDVENAQEIFGKSIMF